jgi:dGTPase
LNSSLPDPVTEAHGDERPPDYRSPRRVQEPEPSSRSETQRDRDRILYSSAFARLAGITQVASSSPGASFHNRLTHSFKVAQVARRLAERLQAEEGDVELVQNLDADAAEAAALGHDTGHPPFGHIAEEILADAMQQAGGFEGNAQSFRIVCRLAMRDPEQRGLNLTPTSLNGMLKYPWLPGDHPGDPESSKFGAYWSDREDFLAAQGKSTVRPGQRTLEAELMDWSDDITYAVHDLEDFYRVGLVPLDRLRTDGDERQRFYTSFFDANGQLRKKFEDADPDHLRERLDYLFLGRLVFDPFVGTSTQRAQLRQASSNLIGDFQAAISARMTADQAQQRVVMIGRDEQADVLILKELTWFYVINRPALALIQEAQKDVVKRLFDTYDGAASPGGRRELLPVAEREAVADDPPDAVRQRVICDFVAGLTEMRALELHGLLTGSRQGTILDATAG